MVTHAYDKAMTFNIALLTAIFLIAAPANTWAMGSSDPEELIEEAQEVIDSGDFEEAIYLLQDVLFDNPDNADAYNLLAYSQRNLDQTDVAMENYKRALEIDPEHKGALEYQGELFLMMGDRTSAEANLILLSKLCPRGCEEHETLQAAIERFKDGNVSWIKPERADSLSE